MSACKIPEILDDALLTRSAAGESTREIAAWLRQEHHLTDCSHMAVSRRLQALTLAHQVPGETSLEELDRRLQSQLLTLDGIHEDLQELSELAELPPDDPRRHDIDLKKFSILNRRVVALAVFRYLATRRRELLIEKVRDEKLAKLTNLALHDNLQRLGEEFRDAQAVRHEQRARSTPPPKPAPAPALTSVIKGANRNKPCPCGSGRKAKKCCLESSVTPTVTPAVLAG